jgi:hypothetical protein
MKQYRFNQGRTERTGGEEDGIVLGREVGRERLAHRVLGGFLDLLRRHVGGVRL